MFRFELFVPLFIYWFFCQNYWCSTVHCMIDKSDVDLKQAKIMNGIFINIVFTTICEDYWLSNKIFVHLMAFFILKLFLEIMFL